MINRVPRDFGRAPNVKSHLWVKKVSPFGKKITLKRLTSGSVICEPRISRSAHKVMSCPFGEARQQA
jgi:hypothetical protein